MRVVVVATGAATRAGLAGLVEAAGDHEVIAQARPEEALLVVGDLDPDLVVLEVRAGDLGMVEKLVRLQADLLVLALVDDERDAAAAIGLGAVIGLSGDTGPGPLGAAMGAAAAGLVVLDVGSARDHFEAIEGRPADDGPRTTLTEVPVETLTARESQVLQLMAAGLTNAAIAYRLGLSPHTAKFHVGTVLAKLGSRSRAEAVAKASRLGWLMV